MSIKYIPDFMLDGERVRVPDYVAIDEINGRVYFRNWGFGTTKVMDVNQCELEIIKNHGLPERNTSLGELLSWLVENGIPVNLYDADHVRNRIPSKSGLIQRKHLEITTERNLTWTSFKKWIPKKNKEIREERDKIKKKRKNALWILMICLTILAATKLNMAIFWLILFSLVTLLSGLYLAMKQSKINHLNKKIGNPYYVN